MSDRRGIAVPATDEFEQIGKQIGVHGGLTCRAQLRPTIRQHDGPQVQCAVRLNGQGRILARNALGFDFFERSTSLIRLTKSKNNSQYASSFRNEEDQND
jgi:hypothetical protein